MTNDRQTKNAASEGTSASHCSQARCECRDPRTVWNGTRNQWICDDCGKPASTYSGRYDEARIAWELHLTASGQSYYGNALYVALDIPCIMASPEHKTAIQRYLRGTQSATDHIRLQEAAMMIAPNAQ